MDDYRHITVALDPGVQGWQGYCHTCKVKFGLLNRQPPGEKVVKPTQCPYCGARAVYVDTEAPR